jgi:hypothetical protein
MTDLDIDLTIVIPNKLDACRRLGVDPDVLFGVSAGLRGQLEERYGRRHAVSPVQRANAVAADLVLLGMTIQDEGLLCPPPPTADEERDVARHVADDDHGPFDPEDLVSWAETYGHPEGWAKRAQAAHARAERLQEELRAARDAAPQAPGAGT